MADRVDMGRLDSPEAQGVQEVVGLGVLEGGQSVGQLLTVQGQATGAYLLGLVYQPGESSEPQGDTTPFSDIHLRTHLTPPPATPG